MVTVLIFLFIITVLQRTLPRFSVTRPVTTSMIFLGIILLGFISLPRLPQELFPPITYPQLTVATSYANAAPEEIETLITKIVEEAISTVKNIKAIRSVSKEGLSLVIADFNWGTDMNIAALNMREKIEPVYHIVQTAIDAMELLGIEPKIQPIRGGTDGARLSFMGLPCPNIFAGGLNFHGKFEYVSLDVMSQATNVILKIIELYSNK